VEDYELLPRWISGGAHLLDAFLECCLVIMLIENYDQKSFGSKGKHDSIGGQQLKLRTQDVMTGLFHRVFCINKQFIADLDVSLILSNGDVPEWKFPLLCMIAANWNVGETEGERKTDACTFAHNAWASRCQIVFFHQKRRVRMQTI
jgi:hypothetical protein